MGMGGRIDGNVAADEAAARERKAKAEEQQAKEYERKAKVGAAAYTRISDMAKVNFTASVDYGKWLVATLFVLNGGILAALKERIDTNSEIALMSVSITSSMLLGFILWWHFQLHAMYWMKLQRETLVLSIEHLPDDREPSIWITITFWMALVCGFISAGAALTTLILVLAGAPADTIPAVPGR